MSTLSDIERATGQSFPPLFKQLHAAGRLSWGAPHPEWSKVVFPTLQADPPVLLYAQEYEPLEHDELLEAWQELTAEDHYNPLLHGPAAAAVCADGWRRQLLLLEQRARCC